MRAMRNFLRSIVEDSQARTQRLLSAAVKDAIYAVTAPEWLPVGKGIRWAPGKAITENFSIPSTVGLNDVRSAIEYQILFDIRRCIMEQIRNDLEMSGSR